MDRSGVSLEFGQRIDGNGLLLILLICTILKHQLDFLILWEFKLLITF